MAFTDYSTTPANNNSAPPNGAPEGMAAALVNDTMRQIMADLRSGVDARVVTIAAMTLLLKTTLTTGLVVQVDGYAAQGDNGGGRFFFDASSTATANGGTIFETDEGGTGRWFRIYEELTILMFGAKNDGSVDFGPALQNAVDVITVSRETLTLPAGTYLQTTSVVKDNFDGLTIIGYGAIIDFQVSNAFKLGDHSVDGSGFSTQFTPTIKNVHIEGVSFISSAPGYNPTTNRNAFLSPLNLSSVDGLRVENCHFEDWDFGAVNIEAASKNMRVINCTFKQNNESDVSYGVRPFNFVVALDNYDETTGLLLFAAPTNSFHDDIIIEGCTFDGLSHSILSWNVHNSKYINNTFISSNAKLFHLNCLNHAGEL